MKDWMITVWRGNYGVYQIPRSIAMTCKVTKDGQPDKRSPKRNAELLAWVEEQEWYAFRKVIQKRLKAKAAQT